MLTSYCVCVFAAFTVGHCLFNSVSQIKELYGTLFVDLRAMSSQERGTTQRKHQSVIEEMKMQRQRMLKQAVSWTQTQGRGTGNVPQCVKGWKIC